MIYLYLLRDKRLIKISNNNGYLNNIFFFLIFIYLNKIINN